MPQVVDTFGSWNRNVLSQKWDKTKVSKSEVDYVSQKAEAYELEAVHFWILNPATLDTTVRHKKETGRGKWSLCDTSEALYPF